MKKRYSINGQIYEIPDSEAGAFLKDNPQAVEVKNFNVQGKEYEIPLTDTADFQRDFGISEKKNGIQPSQPSANGSARSTSVSPGVEAPAAPPIPQDNFLTNPKFNPFAKPLEANPVDQLDPVEKKLFSAQNGYVQPVEVQKQIAANIIEGRKNAVVKYNNAKTYLADDIDKQQQKAQQQTTTPNVFLPQVLQTPDYAKLKADVTDEGMPDPGNPTPAIGYVNDRQRQINAQIADLQKQQYTFPVIQGSYGNTKVPVANFDDLQRQIDQLVKDKQLVTDYGKHIASVQILKEAKTNPDKSKGTYLNMGMEYAGLDHPIDVENKKKNLQSGEDGFRGKKLVQLENAGYEGTGIAMSLDAADILLNTGKIDQGQYDAIVNDANKGQQQMEVKYPALKEKRLKDALGQIIERNRDQTKLPPGAETPTGVRGGAGFTSLWEHIVNGTASDAETKKAVDEMRANGESITDEQAKKLVNDYDLGNTSLVGRAMGGIAGLANRIGFEGAKILGVDHSHSQYEANKAALEERFANTPGNADYQPEQITDINGNKVTNPNYGQFVENPKAGLHNWGWGTLNAVADGVGMIAKLAALGYVTGGAANAALGAAYEGIAALGAEGLAAEGGLAGDLLGGASTLGEASGVEVGAGTIANEVGGAKFALSAAARQHIGTVASMYIDSYPEYYDAATKFIGEKEGGEKSRELFAHTMGILAGGLFTILPPGKIAKDVLGSAEAYAKTWADVVGQKGVDGLNPESVSKFVNTIVNAAETQTKVAGIGALTQAADFTTQALFNPSSVEDRNIGQEIVDGVVKSAAFLPISLAEGFGLAKKIDNMHSIYKEGVFRNADDPSAFRDYMQEQVDRGLIGQEEANAKIRVVNTAAAIKPLIPEELTKPEKVEYGMNVLFAKKLTQENEALKEAGDKNQVDENLKKIDELYAANKKIKDNSKGAEPLPEPPAEVVPPAETATSEVKKRDELLDQARELVDNGAVKDFTANDFKLAAANDPAQFDEFLKNVAEQSKDPRSIDQTLVAYGSDLIDVAQKLHPDVKPPEVNPTEVTPTEEFAPDLSPFEKLKQKKSGKKSEVSEKDKVAVLANGPYQKAIDDGRMTAEEAIQKIEAVGLKVPQDILDRVKPEQPTEKPTEKGLAVTKNGKYNNVSPRDKYKFSEDSDFDHGHTFTGNLDGAGIENIDQSKPFAVGYYGDHEGNRYEHAVAAHDIADIVEQMKNNDHQEGVVEVYNPKTKEKKSFTIYPFANEYTNESVGLAEGKKEPITDVPQTDAPKTDEDFTNQEILKESNELLGWSFDARRDGVDGKPRLGDDLHDKLLKAEADFDSSSYHYINNGGVKKESVIEARENLKKALEEAQAEKKRQEEVVAAIQPKELTLERIPFKLIAESKDDVENRRKYDEIRTELNQLNELIKCP